METTSTIKRKVDQHIVRPKHILEGLIHLELRLAEDAGRPHRLKAGELLVEVKHHFQSNRSFDNWVNITFGVKPAQAKLWMKWADAERAGHRHTHSPLTNKNHAAWYAGVRDAVEDVDVDQFTVERAARDKEQKLESELAISLIEIGYRALAVKLHPDKGGSHEGMTRLNRVRDNLMAAYE